MKVFEIFTNWKNHHMPQHVPRHYCLLGSIAHMPGETKLPILRSRQMKETYTYFNKNSSLFVHIAGVPTLKTAKKKLERIG